MAEFGGARGERRHRYEFNEPRQNLQSLGFGAIGWFLVVSGVVRQAAPDLDCPRSLTTPVSVYGPQSRRALRTTPAGGPTQQKKIKNRTSFVQFYGQ